MFFFVGVEGGLHLTLLAFMFRFDLYFRSVFWLVLPYFLWEEHMYFIIFHINIFLNYHFAENHSKHINVARNIQDLPKLAQKSKREK